MKKYLLLLLTLLPLSACDDKKDDENGNDNGNKVQSVEISKEESTQMVESAMEYLAGDITINSEMSISYAGLISYSTEGMSCIDENGNVYTSQVLTTSDMSVDGSVESFNFETNTIIDGDLIYSYNRMYTTDYDYKTLQIEMNELSVVEEPEYDLSSIEFTGEKTGNTTIISYDLAQHNDMISVIEAAVGVYDEMPLDMSGVALEGKIELKFVDGVLDSLASKNLSVKFNGDVEYSGVIQAVSIPVNISMEFEKGTTVEPAVPADKDSYEITYYPLVGSYEVDYGTDEISATLRVNEDFTFEFIGIHPGDDIYEVSGTVETTDYYTYSLICNDIPAPVTYEDGDFYFQEYLLIEINEDELI